MKCVKGTCLRVRDVFLQYCIYTLLLCADSGNGWFSLWGGMEKTLEMRVRSIGD